MRKRNREENFDLDLMPVISMIAVCICFLLVVVSWVHVGVLQTSGGVSEVSEDEKNDQVVLYVKFSRDNIILSVNGIDDVSPVRFLKNQHDPLVEWITEVKEKNSDLNQALIFLPNSMSYKDFILYLDLIKRSKIQHIGFVRKG